MIKKIGRWVTAIFTMIGLFSTVGPFSGNMEETKPGAFPAVP